MMESPFRSEAAAFRFVLISIAAAAIVVAASWIDRWLGLLVFVTMVTAAIWIYVRQRSPRPPREHVEHVGSPDVRRVLVVANETVGGDELLGAIGELALGRTTRFLVVSPALNSRLKTWTSDEDPARAEAQARLAATLARLAEIGVEARGEVGDADPLVSVDDAVRLFHPDEIVVSTHPEGRSNWLERGIVAAIRERFDVPVTHVVVDLQAAEAAGRGSSASSS